jgi:hypothetical protein
MARNAHLSAIHTRSRKSSDAVHVCRQKVSDFSLLWCYRIGPASLVVASLSAPNSTNHAYALTFRSINESAKLKKRKSRFICREAVSRASALVVLSSMNATAREVFRLVADAQLDSEGDGGLPFQRLFQQCRDRFVVSNQMALTAFLTEFKDHNIVTTKRGSDGAELLCVPLEAEALRHVLSEMEAGR